MKEPIPNKESLMKYKRYIDDYNLVEKEKSIDPIHKKYKYFNLDEYFEWVADGEENPYYKESYNIRKSRSDGL